MDVKQEYAGARRGARGRYRSLRHGLVLGALLVSLPGCVRFAYEEDPRQLGWSPPDAGDAPRLEPVEPVDAAAPGAVFDAGASSTEFRDAALDAGSPSKIASSDSGAGGGIDARTADKRRSITINAGVVGTHSNFPLLVSLRAEWLRTKITGGEIASASGYDIHFSSDTGQALDHEVERYDGAAGLVVAWVRVPVLKAGTLLFIHHGDPTLTASQENAGGVWADYAGVWHMSGAADATSNHNHVTSNAAVSDQPTGKVGAAIGFNGVNSSMRVGSDASLDDVFANGGTVSAWINPVPFLTFGTAWPAIACKNSTVVPRPDGQNPSDSGWELLMGATFATTIDFRYGFSGTSAWSTPHWQSDSQTYGDGRWLAVVVQYTPTSGLTPPTFIINKTRSTSTVFGPAYGGQAGTAPRSDADDNFAIGNRFAGDRPFDGVIDEVRVYRSIRSLEWIATEYDNQNDPASFYSVSDAL